MALLMLLPIVAKAQTSVALSPVPAQQFFSQGGLPLASGCIYTFISGTSTQLATFTDGTGTATNPNPIILDAGGFGNIWLSNSSYRFQIWSFGSGAVGSNCGNGTLQRTVDNISAYTVINQAQNIFLSGQSSDPGGTAGELIYRSDIPCFRAFTTFWDCLVSLTGTQTLLNKTMTSPTLNTPTITGPTITLPETLNGVTVPAANGFAVTNTIGTYSVMTSSGTPPSVGGLVKLTGVGTVTATAGTDTGGAIGIAIATVGGGGGTATIQHSGLVNCTFNGATTANDYVQISSNGGGNCSDAGATFPASGQVVGRVLSTNAAGGTYQILLFGPENRGGALGAATGCTNFTPVTISSNNTQQNLQSCSIVANSLVQGSLLGIELTGIESNASAGNTLYSISLGGGTACQVQPTQGNANNQPWNISVKFFVLTAGAGGTANMSCEYFSTSSGGGVVGAVGIVGAPTISINTTISNTLQVTEQMSVSNAGNIVTEQGLKAVVY